MALWYFVVINVDVVIILVIIITLAVVTVADGLSLERG